VREPRSLRAAIDLRWKFDNIAIKPLIRIWCSVALRTGPPKELAAWPRESFLNKIIYAPVTIRHRLAVRRRLRRLPVRGLGA
jgi:hypothetical protein